MMISLLESKNIDKFRQSFPDFLFQKSPNNLLEVYLLSLKDVIIGYGVLNFQSSYPPFAKTGIPEIKDVSVLVEYKNQGFEEKLIEHMEKIVIQKGSLVIGMKVQEGKPTTKCLNERLVRFCTKFVPGNLLHPPEILFGGALHHSWKIVTDQGKYVVKEINPQIVKKPHIHDAYEFTEKVAYTFYSRGLPAVAAIKTDSHFVHTFENCLYIIYPFIQGHIIFPENLTKIHAQIVGFLFKIMHGASPSFDLKKVDPHYDLFSDKCWSAIIHDSKDPRLAKLLPDILNWNDRYKDAIQRLNSHSVISHRDLHYSNVLWNHLQPSIIDWESAGYTNPLQELIGFAFEWSGIIQATFRKEIFQTILSSYASPNFTSRTSTEDAFFGWLGNSILGWTEFNIKRAFDKTLPPSEQTKGLTILSETLIPCLTFIQENLDNLLKICSER
jgi:hypothetical protein